MTTQDLLSHAVVVAGEEIYPQLGTIAEHVADVGKIPAALRTSDEKALFKVAKASKSSLPLINIATAIKAGGVRPDNYPNLAIASYEMSFQQKDCHVFVNSDGSVVFQDDASDWPGWSSRFPAGTLPAVTGFWSWVFPIGASTAVPLVPSVLRQKNPKDVVLLFEVAEWKPEIRKAVDPYLLKQVAGDIYAVIGTWDVSERELKAYQTARSLRV